MSLTRSLAIKLPAPSYSKLVSIWLKTILTASPDSTVGRGLRRPGGVSFSYLLCICICMEKIGVLVSPALPGIWVPFGGRGEPEGWRGAARGARWRAEGHGGGRRGPPRRHFSVALGQVDWVGVFSSCGLCPVQLGREISSKLMTRRLYFLFYFLTREIEYGTTGLTLSALRRAQEGQTLCGGDFRYVYV